VSLLFTHYLITRYNVPLEGWETDKSGGSTRDTAWLVHRMELFKNYCLPSIIAQTEQNFLWLIYCDEATPIPILEILQKSIGTIKNATVRLTSGYHACILDIDYLLAQSNTPYVITSRVDNDDSLGIHYIKTVQRHFIPQNGVILNLLHGHGYNVSKRIGTKLYNIRNNHFSSLIEKTRSEGGHISIRGFQHDNPPAEFIIQNIQNDNSWLKVFHERNLKSNPFGYPVFRNKFFEWYGLKNKNITLSVLNTFQYSIGWLLTGIYRKIKKLLHNNAGPKRY